MHTIVTKTEENDPMYALIGRQIWVVIVAEKEEK